LGRDVPGLPSPYEQPPGINARPIDSEGIESGRRRTAWRDGGRNPQTAASWLQVRGHLVHRPQRPRELGRGGRAN